MWDLPWLDFVVIAVPLGVVVAVLRRRAWRRWVRALIFLVSVGVCVSVAFIGAGVRELGPSLAWYEQTPVREIVLFVVMLLGTVARYITKAIEERRARIQVLQEKNTPFEKPGLEWDAWELSYPLFVSIVTFGALLSQIKEPSLGVASVVLSFQTGFFWQTVLASRQQSST